MALPFSYTVSDVFSLSDFLHANGVQVLSKWECVKQSSMLCRKHLLVRRVCSCVRACVRAGGCVYNVHMYVFYWILVDVFEQREEL